MLRVLVFFELLLCSYSLSAAEHVGVIYPIVREPFSQVYSDIVTGIKKGFPDSVSEYPVNGNSIPLIQAIKASGKEPDALIALGNKSLKLAMTLNKPMFAAVPQLPSLNNLSGVIILKPSADVYLSRLMEIYPKVKTIHVVYNPKKHEDLIDDANVFLREVGRTINAVPATDIRESARGFRGIVKKAKPGDAVWLISDSGLIDTSILGLVLDSAWDKRLAVFSSNPEFVKRGALFAIYPDNVGLGERLAGLVLDVTQKKLPEGNIEYLKNVKIAYNDRTGNHIGIKLTPESKASIDLMLPEF